MKKRYLFICIIVFLGVFSCAKKEHKAVDITVIHINDIQSCFEPIPLDITLGGKTYKVKSGAYSYLSSAVKELKDKSENPIFLHSGNVICSSNLKESMKDDILALNSLNLDAMTIASNELNEDSKNLSIFLSSIKSPKLSANVKTDKINSLKNIFAPYIIKEIDGEEIAIIGINKIFDSSKDLIFKDEVSTINKIATKLTKKGINKILVLASCDYETSIKICKELKNIDIFISGASSSLLGKDFDKIGLKSDGEYPTVVNSADNSPIYIVQAWECGKVLGVLKVNFSKDGDVLELEDNSKLIINSDVCDEDENILMDEDFKYFYVLSKGTDKIMLTIEDDTLVLEK